METIAGMKSGNFWAGSRGSFPSRDKGFCFGPDTWQEAESQRGISAIMTADAVVIIPHFNDVARLDRCLKALTAQDLSGVEVLVVDNASTESLGALVAAYPGLRFTTEHAKGAALARNRGVAESQAETLIFLDADCVPAAGWLAAARAAAPRADIVGGAIDVFDETPPPRSGAEAFETVFAFNYKDYIERKGFSVTANLVTTRSVFEAVGPFVDGLSEDAEWCLRARDKGFVLALDEGMRVAHPTRSDWPALRRKWLRVARELFALHQARRPGIGGRIRWALRAMAMPLSAVAHLPKVLFSRKLGGAGERLRGAVTLIRLRLLRAYWMLRQSVGASL